MRSRSNAPRCAGQEELLECCDAPEREQDAGSAAAPEIKQHFEHRSGEQAAAAGAESDAHREFAALLRGARHLQVDDVSDGDEQHEQRDPFDPERDLSRRIERALLRAARLERRE